jgi:hypothetical protein
MSIIRTFHAVGQGAFYIEEHTFNGNPFTIVYDCGSSSFRRESFHQKIRTLINKGQIIDMLFISHFHADHINGIAFLAKHCVIRKVVIPLLDDTAKIMIRIQNLIENGYTEMGLIESPEDFFSENTQIIKIEPAELSDKKIDLEYPINLNRTRSSRLLPSGTILIPFENADWYFIPYNYKYLERKTEFKNALADFGLTIEDLHSIGKIHDNIDSVIKAYLAVDGNLNNNSMVLFSGVLSDNQIKFYDFLHHTDLNKFFASNFQSGCLYLGDLNLNSRGIIDDLLSKFNQLFQYVGTIQIPHHGSGKNFNSAILQPSFKSAIISYGKYNNYGHPSIEVFDALIAERIFPHLVDEDKKTQIIQFN